MKHVVLSTVNSHANLSSSLSSIPVLNGSNFKSWKENLLIVLGVMDLDLAIRTDSPTALSDKSTPDEKKDMEKWEKSNRMSLMIIKRAISESFRGSMPDSITNAKDFLSN